MKAVIYVRVSTQEQVTEGISLENQTEKIKAYCYARSWDVIDIVSDEGFSGKSLNRPGIQRIIEKAKHKEFDVVVTYKLDRLTRSVRDLGYLIEDIFNKQDIAFTSVLDNFDTSTANGKLILNILGSVAQWERDICAERVRDAISYKKQNKQVYNHPPLGYIVNNNNELVEIESEQKTIKFIKHLRENGYGYGKIVNHLNQKKLLTKKGGSWHKSTVKKILLNTIHT